MRTYTPALFCLLLLSVLINPSCKKSSSEEALPDFNSCDGKPIQGHLSYNSSTGIYVYHSSGTGIIEIDPRGSIRISDSNYPDFFIELWGSATSDTLSGFFHENLKRKYVKDRIAANRTIIFPDEAKITIESAGLTGPIRSFSIYDGMESHHVKLDCSTGQIIVWSTANSELTDRLDARDPDGETGGYRVVPTGILFQDYYIENTAGNKIIDTIPIGETYFDDPHHVDDYWP